MNNKLLRSVFLVASSLALIGSPVFAQSADSTQSAAQPSYAGRLSDSLRGEARDAFGRATSLFDAGNFAAARVEFEQAHTLSGDARLLYNVAVCDKELGRYARAIRELQKSVDLGGSTLPKRYQRRVVETIRTLEPFVTTLTVDTKHAGATVFVDDEPMGETPLDGPISIDVGERVVRLAKPGFRGNPMRVRAASGSPVAVQLTLEAVQLRQRISIRATGLPRGEQADVLVDGVVVGEAPWSGEVAVGARRVVVRSAGYDDSVRTVQVKSGEAISLSLRMKPSQRLGRVRIRAGNPDDTITLNGRVVGQGSYDGRIGPGEHALRVTRPGAKTYDMDFVLRPGETRSMNVTLESGGGGVPAWVWIAGGVVVAGATTATLLLTNKETQYDGQAAGTLPPRVVPASYNMGAY
ncbi:MAG: PEGA domain-containing protein [Polyangiaceae bacterium]|jgi:tetratricopeptide (TPR) repeat protein|nr:PEGA domain-containing protein [Polyangiaceae bacterium]